VSASLELFPNPASASAFVSVRLTEPDEVRVTVFDMIGRTVVELDPVRIAAGARTNIALELDELPSGRYVVRAAGGAASVTGLLTVVR
jgi:hypothetical protein